MPCEATKRRLTQRPRLSHMAAAAMLAALTGAAQAASCEAGAGVTQIGVQLFALAAYEDGSFDYSWRQLRCERGQVQTIVGTTVQGQYPDQAIADNRRLNMSRVIRNACGSMAVIVHERFRGKIRDASGAAVDFSALPLDSEHQDLFRHSLQDSEGPPMACPQPASSSPRPTSAPPPA